MGCPIVVTLHDQDVVQREGQYYVAVPGEWEGLREGKVLQIVDDVVMMVPSYVARLTGNYSSSTSSKPSSRRA
jgi:hypothetical protein